MKAYKLLTQDKTSRGGCKWELNEWKQTSGEGGLCSAGWLHFYEHPLLAVLHNQIHAGIENPRLFEVEIAEDAKIKKDGMMKLGATKARITKELLLPKINNVQRIAYGVLCAKEVFKDEKWNLWADKWLSGEDRSYSAAYAAYAADSAANAAYAADSAAKAAYYAADAADSAAYAAYAADAADAADAAYYAAAYAAYAADAAYYAAAYAADYAAADLDLPAIAEKAMEVK